MSTSCEEVYAARTHARAACLCVCLCVNACVIACVNVRAVARVRVNVVWRSFLHLSCFILWVCGSVRSFCVFTDEWQLIVQYIYMLLIIFVQMYTWDQPRLPNMNDSVTSFLYHLETSLLDSMFRTQHFLRVFVGHVQLAFWLAQYFDFTELHSR